jgi:pimeloyl-ACP methyl ester carboxylesterase
MSSFEAGTEIRLRLPSWKIELAGRSLGDATSKNKVLALHGWMDNAATHEAHSQAWTSLGWHFLALDLPGHGRSGHLTSGEGYTAMTYAACVLEALEALGPDWATFALASHSMGAGVSSIVAGTLPERTRLLVLLEGMGMNTKEPDEAPSSLLKAHQGRSRVRATAAKT